MQAIKGNSKSRNFTENNQNKKVYNYQKLIYNL